MTTYSHSVRGMKPLITMKKQPRQGNLLSPLPSLYIQDTVQKGDSRYYTKLRKRLAEIWIRKFVRSISPLVKYNLKSPRLALLQPRASLWAKEKSNSGYCVQWTTEGQCSRGERCAMKHDPENEWEPTGKGKGSRPVQLSTTDFFGKRDTRLEKVLQNKSKVLPRLKKGDGLEGNSCDSLAST